MGSEKVDCFSNPNNKWLQYLNNNKWFFKENNKWLDNIIILMLAFVKLDHDLYRFQQFIAKAQKADSEWETFFERKSKEN